MAIAWTINWLQLKSNLLSLRLLSFVLFCFCNLRNGEEFLKKISGNFYKLNWMKLISVAIRVRAIRSVIGNMSHWTGKVTVNNSSTPIIASILMEKRVSNVIQIYIFHITFHIDCWVEGNSILLNYSNLFHLILITTLI